LKPSTAKLLKKQNGKCNWCGLNFLDGDSIDTDHIIPKRAGGNNSQDNLQLLHKHCHLSKTYSDQLVIKLHKAKKEEKKTQALVQ
jgi:RNA-directed DNA polymerase